MISEGYNTLTNNLSKFEGKINFILTNTSCIEFIVLFYVPISLHVLNTRYHTCGAQRRGMRSTWCTRVRRGRVHLCRFLYQKIYNEHHQSRILISRPHQQMTTTTIFSCIYWFPLSCCNKSFQPFLPFMSSHISALRLHRFQPPKVCGLDQVATPGLKP